MTEAVITVPSNLKPSIQDTTYYYYYYDKYVARVNLAYKHSLSGSQRKFDVQHDVALRKCGAGITCFTRITGFRYSY